MLSTIAALAALVAGGSAPPTSPGQGPLEPSFRCGAGLSPTEALICGDEELGAYDRAVAFAFERKWRPSGQSWATQRQWLDRRNRCGPNRECVLAAYREWISGLSAETDIGPSLRRVAMPPADGSDLMLGTLQSPKARVKAIGDPAHLSAVALGGEWILFQASAAHLYDPGDGRGANASTSEAVGVVRLNGGTGTFLGDPSEPDACAIELTRLPKGRWKIEENGRCSGLGSTLDGIYGK